MYNKNPRPGPDNHRQDRQNQTYSSVAAPRIPQKALQPHDGVLGKSHTSANAVVLQQQSLQNQMSNVNSAGPQMTASAVGNSGSNLPVMTQNVQMPQTGNRYQVYHQRQGHQRQPLLPNQNPHRTQNTVPQNQVQQQVQQQSVGPHNMVGHPTPHYYMPTHVAQHMQHQLQNQMPVQIGHHLAPNYRTIQTGIQPGVPYYSMVTQPAYQTTPYSPYMPYNPSGHYSAHPQQTAQMMSSQMHQQRGATVSAPVMTAPQQMSVQMTAPNNDMNESTPIPIPPQKSAPQKRTKTVAIISDPNTGKTIDINELAKEEPKNQTPVIRNHESHTGASNLPNTSSDSNSNDAEGIALEFITKVALSTTPPTVTTVGAVVSEDTICVNSDIVPMTGKLENDDSVAISETSLSESLSETNDKNSDICDDSNHSVIKTNSSISASISFDNKTDEKLLNNISAQNSNEIYSQLSVENSSVQTASEVITENGDLNETIELKGETPSEKAKELSIQKINNNNNNRKKDMIKKGDNNRKLDNNLDIDLVVTDNVVTVIDKVEPQPITDPSLPVMLSTLSNENVNNLVKSEDICNNICENDLQTKNSENNRINELHTNEVIVEQSETKTTIPSIPTTLPNLPYKSDQWTPLNPEGKKQYERDFLLAVRDKSESSLKMPESLNNSRNQEIVRKESSGGHSGMDPTFNFMPTYATKPFGNRLNMPPITGRRQSQPGRLIDKQRKIISTSLTQEVNLHHVVNAWKPEKLVSTAVDPEEQKTLELLKKIRGNLNKLTPQKYDVLVVQIASFFTEEFITEDRLKRVLDLIFEKAVDEPSFCLQYANLCKHLSLHLQELKVFAIDGKEVKFHKLLLTKCQKEFEADVYASITDLKERREDVEKCSEPQKKRMMFEVLDEDMRRARKRSLGNVKLIGELYKLNMLKANIMINCIGGLIKESDDESLECLCALLKTIGEQIETDLTESLKDPKSADNSKKYRQLLDQFFSKMDAIAEQNINTSSRVRFMLRDVNDMRKNKWKARREENLPKMIDDIHKEAQKEDEQTQREIHQHSLNRKHDDRDRKQKGGRQPNESSDGFSGGSSWTTVTGRKSQTASQQNVDWNKLRSTQQQNHDNVQLGPQTGTWGLGSRGGAQSSQSKVPIDDKQINRFSPLDTNDRKSQKSSIPSRDSSKGRSNQQHSYQQPGRGGRPQGNNRADGEREDAINLARSFAQKQSPSESSPIYPSFSRNSSRSGSREASAPNSRNSSIRRETPDIDTNPLKGGPISVSELEGKCLVSFNEYLNVKNFDDPVLDVTTLCNESNVHIYVSTAITRVLESSSHSNYSDSGKLFNHLISKNIIKLNHFYKGLNSILENASDMEIDIPKLWEYISQILVPIFVNLTENRKKFMLEVITKCKNDKKAKFVANIFKHISKMTSEGKAHELWVSSDLRWNEFLDPNEDIISFVEENGVKFTINVINDNANDYKVFIKEVEQIIRKKNTSDEIHDYISKHFNVEQTQDCRFTNALLRAVLNACINQSTFSKESYYVDETLLAEFCPILAKFLGADAERELQALNTLVEIMVELEHPSNLLCKIFEVLNNQSVISFDAFVQWHGSDSTSPGKATAAVSVVRFFTWLRENEDDDDDNDEEDTERTGS